jgi:pyrroline-5-carboxylate reductase
MNTSIGIIGLGRLGSALARGIDRSGHTGGPYAFNRGAPKAQAVTAHPGGRSEAGGVHLRATLPPLYEAMLQKMRKWQVTGFKRAKFAPVNRRTTIAPNFP